jgi:hypothetical protein
MAWAAGEEMHVLLLVHEGREEHIWLLLGKD